MSRKSLAVSLILRYDYLPTYLLTTTPYYQAHTILFLHSVPTKTDIRNHRAQEHINYLRNANTRMLTYLSTREQCGMGWDAMDPTYMPCRAEEARFRRKARVG